jgi:hypothetical protein
MQTNLPKKFHRRAGKPVTVEKQIFMKLRNSFTELDQCTDRSVHFLLCGLTLSACLASELGCTPGNILSVLYVESYLTAFNRTEYVRTYRKTELVLSRAYSVALFHVIDDSVLPGFISRHPIFAIEGDQYFRFRPGSDSCEDLSCAITSKLETPFHSVHIVGGAVYLNRWLAKTNTGASVRGPLSLCTGSQEDGTDPDRLPNTIGPNIAR